MALRTLHEISTHFGVYRKEEKGKYEEKELVFVLVADFKMLSVTHFIKKQDAMLIAN
jgi:hypothetical protein